jgi:hypothetical protein
MSAALLYQGKNCCLILFSFLIMIKYPISVVKCFKYFESPDFLISFGVETHQNGEG